MLHAECPVKRVQRIPMFHHATSKTMNSVPAKKQSLDYLNDLPPISILETKPSKRNESLKLPQCLSSGLKQNNLNRISNEIRTCNVSPIQFKVNESVEETLSDSKVDNPKVERSFSVESEEELPVVVKKPKLRIQPTDKYKYRHTMKFIPKSNVDPNIVKRKEMIKYLKQVQNQMYRPYRPTNENRFTKLYRDISSYCNNNNFFKCEYKDNELRISSFGFLQKRFVIVFKPESENFENWGFPKPKSLDGKEICDSILLEHMKKQPTVETFMNELFVCYYLTVHNSFNTNMFKRIAANVISEVVCM